MKRKQLIKKLEACGFEISKGDDLENTTIQFNESNLWLNSGCDALLLTDLLGKINKADEAIEQCKPNNETRMMFKLPTTEFELKRLMDHHKILFGSTWLVNTISGFQSYYYQKHVQEYVHPLALRMINEINNVVSLNYEN